MSDTNKALWRQLDNAGPAGQMNALISLADRVNITGEVRGDGQLFTELLNRYGRGLREAIGTPGPPDVGS